MTKLNVFEENKFKSPLSALDPPILRWFYSKEDKDYTENLIRDAVDTALRGWIARTDKEGIVDDDYFEENYASKKDAIIIHNSLLTYMRDAHTIKRQFYKSILFRINVIILLLLWIIFN